MIEYLVAADKISVGGWRYPGFSDIGRGAVRCLEDGAVGTDVGAGGHTQATHQASAQVIVTMSPYKIGQHQTSVVVVLDQAHAGGVDDLVAELDIG